MVYLRLYREELRGISRGKDAKDVDWASVASSVVVEVTEKPQPIKISLSDVLSRVKKPTKNIVIKNNNAAVIDKFRKYQIINKSILIIKRLTLVENRFVTQPVQSFTE